MTKTSTRILATVLFLIAVACGGQPKPVQAPNDEVTAPLGAEDQAALENNSPREDEESDAPVENSAVGSADESNSEEDAPPTAP